MEFVTDTPAQDLTYSDVFLVPRRSAVVSRFDVDLSAGDGTGSTTPVVAANMTAVSGRRMAETLARRGGLAVLPQDIPLPVAADTIRWVKDRHPLYETPVRVSPGATVLEALHLLPKRSHGHGVVVDDADVVVGTVAAGSLTGVDRFTAVADVMEPVDHAVTAGHVDLGATYDRMTAARLSFAPVVDADGGLVGALTPASLLRADVYIPNLDAVGRLRIAAAIGVNGSAVDRARDLVAAGADVLVVDTAHGHQEKMLDVLRGVRDLDLGVPVVAGNVVTAEGVADLVGAGADIVKVGVGPGAMCTTRMMTAVG
ncbi:IMP dehydrogenase, partial [Brevibacterium litoralis]|uniref:IMP dehydrogenase n=1 Tax=Brevibacterium litoralis TaxID=3138935 RepID=UPI0032EABC77